MKYTINFYIDKSASESELGRVSESFKICNKAKLRMRIRWKQINTVSLGVGFLIDASGWDKKTQRCIRDSIHGRDGNIMYWVVNARLSEMEHLAHEVMASCSESVSAQEVRHRMNVALGRVKNEFPAIHIENPRQDFLMGQWLELFIQEQYTVKGWQRSTLAKYRELTGYLQSFDQKVMIEDINEKWMRDFLEYLLAAGLRNVTIVKLLDMLSWFLHWANERGLIKDTSWQQFKPQLNCLPRKVVFLNWEELTCLQNIDLSYAPELEDVRDLFCLQCYTSLRYSDVSQLTCAQIKEDRIEVVAHKTSTPLTIELNRHAKAILDRHKGKHTPFAMPQKSVQRVNLLLKEIGRRACLMEPIQMVWYVGSSRREKTYFKWQLLSSHCGRRTFICISLAMGIPPETVMRWTGHSNYKSMKPYIDVADETRKREMSKWDSWKN